MQNDLIEYYYASGYLPDRYYNQLNEKPADENYREQVKKRSGRYNKNKSFLENFVINLLNSSLYVVLK